MDSKFCMQCNNDLPISNFGKCKSCRDGYYRYCKTCANRNSKKSAFKYQYKDFNQDGFLTEQEQFNAALEQYAAVFNCPNLLKYKKL